MHMFAFTQHAISEKAITQLQNKMDIEHSHVDKTISILDKKVEKEVANLLATFERYRNDVIKYAAGEFRLQRFCKTGSKEKLMKNVSQIYIL